MSKFKDLVGKGIAVGKTVQQRAMSGAMPVMLTTAGVVAAQKFFDFKTMFPNVKPDNVVIKHEGLVKVGAVVVTLAVWKDCPDWLKWMLIGVAVQGGIKAVRQYTMNKEGKAIMEQIGAEDEYSAAIQAAAERIKSITTEHKTGVGDVDGTLRDNSVVGVGGMGSDSNENWWMKNAA